MEHILIEELSERDAPVRALRSRERRVYPAPLCVETVANALWPSRQSSHRIQQSRCIIA